MCGEEGKEDLNGGRLNDSIKDGLTEKVSLSGEVAQGRDTIIRPTTLPRMRLLRYCTSDLAYHPFSTPKLRALNTSRETQNTLSANHCSTTVQTHFL